MRVAPWLKLGTVLVATTSFASADRPSLPNWTKAPWDLGFQDQSARLVNSPITGVTHSYSARSGDFDGDGLTDLVVFQYKPPLGACGQPYAATCYGQTRLLINSNGTLVDETATRLPARNEPSLFGQVADFNKDGHLDIALVNLKNGLVPDDNPNDEHNFPGVPSIRVLMNDGAGNFLTGEQGHA